MPWVRLEPMIYFRAELQKYFVRFLVQVKIAKIPFKINWPLIFDTILWSKIKRFISKVYSFIHADGEIYQRRCIMLPSLFREYKGGLISKTNLDWIPSSNKGAKSMCLSFSTYWVKRLVTLIFHIFLIWKKNFRD